MCLARAGVIASVGIISGCDVVFGLDAPGVPKEPTYVDAAFAHDVEVASLTYAFAMPAGEARALIVSVQLGSACAPVTPEIIGVAYAARTLTPIAAIVGTPCAADATRSAQWLLVDPPVGTGDVVVTLSGRARTVHSGALAFVGVDPDQPVRSTATASGTGLVSSVAVTSATGDLVVNTVGQGAAIAGPGAEATARYVINVDNSNTLNNAAASTIPGGEPAITTTWSFGGSDEWQTISTSLRPVPR